MYDVISIGSSIIDSFITSKSFQVQKNEHGVFLCQEYGEKIDVDGYVVKTGGGGSNTAVGFARMGFRTALVTEVGTDVLADFILQDLRSEFVATNLVVSEKHEQTGGSVILLGADGGRTVMVHRGAASQLDPKDIPTQALMRAKWIHISSIAGQLETLKYIFSVVSGRHSGKADDSSQPNETAINLVATPKLSWNPGNKEIELLKSGELSVAGVAFEALFVNQSEWTALASVKEQLLASCKQIIITQGSGGGEIIINGKPSFKFLSQKVPVVDETGAGDSFIVGYVSAQIKGKSSIESCNWGKLNAQSVIAHVGAKPGLLTITQIESHNTAHA